MATKRKKTGGSLAGLQGQAKRLRKQLSDIKKSKREETRKSKLSRTVKSLKTQVANARKRTKK